MLSTYRSGEQSTRRGSSIEAADSQTVDSVRLQQVLSDCGEAIYSLDSGLAQLVQRLQGCLDQAAVSEAEAARLQAAAHTKFDE